MGPTIMPLFKCIMLVPNVMYFCIIIIIIISLYYYRFVPTIIDNEDVCDFRWSAECQMLWITLKLYCEIILLDILTFSNSSCSLRVHIPLHSNTTGIIILHVIPMSQGHRINTLNHIIHQLITFPLCCRSWWAGNATRHFDNYYSGLTSLLRVLPLGSNNWMVEPEHLVVLGANCEC